ncbi:unnamed protein product [Wickerhamomyces anomalus]
MLSNSRLAGSRLSAAVFRSGLGRASRPVVHKILTRRQISQSAQQLNNYQEDRFRDAQETLEPLDRNDTSYQNLRASNARKLRETLDLLKSAMEDQKPVNEILEIFTYSLNDLDSTERSFFQTRTKIGPVINEMIDMAEKELANPVEGATIVTPDEILQSAIALNVADVINFEKVIQIQFKNGQVSDVLSLWVSYLEYAATLNITFTPNILKNYTYLAFMESCAKENRELDDQTVEALLQSPPTQRIANLSKVVKENVQKNDPRYKVLMGCLERLYLKDKNPNSLAFLTKASAAANTGNSMRLDESYANIEKVSKFTGIKINEETLTHFMGFYNKIGRHSTAMGFWNEIVKAGIIPSTAAWNHLLDTARNLGPKEKRLSNVEGIFEQIPAKNDDTYVRMILIYSNFKAYDKLEALMDETKLASPAIAQVYAQSLISRGETEKAQKIFEGLKSKNMALNLGSYNTLLKTHIRHKDIKAAKKVLKEMKASGVNPDVATYSMIIDLTFKESRLRGDLINDDVISKILEDMRLNGIEPNTYTLTSVIDGLGKDPGYEESALKLFQYLQEKHLASSVTYVSMISNAFNYGNTRQAELYFKDYIQEGFKLTVPIWNLIFEGYLKNRNSSKVAEYYKVFRQADDVIFKKANKFTLYFLLKTAKNHSDFELANLVLSDIAEQGFEKKLSTQTIDLIKELQSNPSVTIPESVEASL